MKIEFKRHVCTGWFQCVQKWDEFEMNVVEGKADLPNGEKVSEHTFVLDVPEGEQERARATVDACPTNAIVLHDDTADVGGEPD